MFVAGRQLKIAEGDYREIGDRVPEAAGWPNLRAYLKTGHIKEIDEDENTPGQVSPASGDGDGVGGAPSALSASADSPSPPLPPFVRPQRRRS